MRTIRDSDLKSWEVYATTGDHGFSKPARIVFRCVSDPGQRPRSVRFGGGKAEAEAAVTDRTEAELRAMLEGEAVAID